MKAIVTSARVERLIHIIRNQTVMLDSDLAQLYGVKTRNLNLAVKRNRDRFPEDFMFQLSLKEAQNLMLQFATSRKHGGVRKPPNVFTEQGVAMVRHLTGQEIVSKADWSSRKYFKVTRPTRDRKIEGTTACRESGEQQKTCMLMPCNT